MRPSFLAAFLLFAGSGAVQAQTVPQPAPAAPALGPVDPARLAVADRLVAKLLPAGIYKQLFDKSFSAMMDKIVGQVGEMPVAKLAQMGGVTEAQAQALGAVKMREIMEIYDPAWRERQRRTMQVITAGMGDIMTRVEPKARVALARAYAREFSGAELEDLDRYFATPAGAHYASRALLIAMGPDMMEAMNAIMPELTDAMPGLVRKAQAATADLPAVRTKGDLSPAERKKLAELFGVDPETLEDHASSSTGTE
ncbi:MULTISPECIES: hypothetical protein [unclassified Sphingomonas]|uniref:hypothetical protein n=1 Tax=Sphingomonas TaxID=13687 RepID=UPI0009651DA0|nr:MULTISPECIES: hypothetical protein [unclassified Sphingomonas]MBN8809973.1 hypothetical protein [Sphingomonas sp.]OJY50570.1 MAG: hypothetical protein BGP17_19245 [Sphingomonas sp. 67-41]